MRTSRSEIIDVRGSNKVPGDPDGYSQLAVQCDSDRQYLPQEDGDRSLVRAIGVDVRHKVGCDVEEGGRRYQRRSDVTNQIIEVPDEFYQPDEEE